MRGRTGTECYCSGVLNEDSLHGPGTRPDILGLTVFDCSLFESFQ